MKVDAGIENWECEYSVQNDVIRGDIHTCFNLFLKILTDGAVTTDAGSLFQYLTTLA